MVQQAERFGAEVVLTRKAVGLRAAGEQRHLALDDGTDVVGSAVLLACGVSFRWLDAPGCAQLVGAGVYYGAATIEAASCADQDVYVLGGGNSAGQAALFLARVARTVHILTRDGSLDESMSDYLVRRIERTPNIVVHLNTTVADAGGNGHVEWIEVKDTETGRTRRVPAYALFVFVGATPRSDWLDGVVDRDDQGFVLAGVDDLCSTSPTWPLERRPYLLETSVPGVFAAGDVRKGSVKRMTAAAGEGAMAVQFVHRYMRETFGWEMGLNGRQALAAQSPSAAGRSAAEAASSPTPGAPAPAATVT
jgi:thioredoxin reductase (NADPH)